MTTAKPETPASELTAEQIEQIRGWLERRGMLDQNMRDLCDMALSALPASPPESIGRNAPADPIEQEESESRYYRIGYTDGVQKCIKSAYAQIQALRGLLPAPALSPSAEEAARIPDGMQLVPKQMTPEMITAWRSACMRCGMNDWQSPWQAVLAAAPEAMRVNTGSGE